MSSCTLGQALVSDTDIVTGTVTDTVTGTVDIVYDIEAATLSSEHGEGR